MRSIFAGMIDSVFSIGSAAAGETGAGGVLGTTFAIPAPPVGGGQENEVVVEYTEQTAPTSFTLLLEGGNIVNASDALIPPLEVLATINTLGQKTIRQKTGRYRFVRLNLAAMAGASAEVTGKIRM